MFFETRLAMSDRVEDRGGLSQLAVVMPRDGVGHVIRELSLDGDRGADGRVVVFQSQLWAWL
jgi:hypothetical protein